MSNLYVAEATVRSELGNRSPELLDWDEDGSEDSGLLGRLIEKAGRFINMTLRQRYGSAIPFAEITDDPATPEAIQEIALDWVLWRIYSRWEPEGRDAEFHRTSAESALEGLREGDFDLGNVARAKGYEAGVVAIYDSGTPTYGGEDSAGVERTKGI